MSSSPGFIGHGKDRKFTAIIRVVSMVSDLDGFEGTGERREGTPAKEKPKPALSDLGWMARKNATER
jgi:hypothetical protein